MPYKMALTFIHGRVGRESLTKQGARRAVWGKRLEMELKREEKM